MTTLYAASDDGETGASYEQAAQWAAEKGMVLTGDANDALTRGAAMELLYAAFGALNITADPVEGDPWPSMWMETALRRCLFWWVWALLRVLLPLPWIWVRR